MKSEKHRMGSENVCGARSEEKIKVVLIRNSRNFRNRVDAQYHCENSIVS